MIDSTETVARLDHTWQANDSAESSQSRGSIEARLAQTLSERLGPAVSFATTEHFNLQTARVATVSEANGRASLYLAALSSNLIALAFIGQMSLLGTAFYAFALILLAATAAHHRHTLVTADRRAAPVYQALGATVTYVGEP